MVSSVAANLIADLVWAPAVWLWVRAWRRHRQSQLEAHARTHELLTAVHKQLKENHGDLRQ